MKQPDEAWLACSSSKHAEVREDPTAQRDIPAAHIEAKSEHKGYPGCGCEGEEQEEARREEDDRTGKRGPGHFSRKGDCARVERVR